MHQSTIAPAKQRTRDHRIRRSAPKPHDILRQSPHAAGPATASLCCGSYPMTAGMPRLQCRDHMLSVYAPTSRITIQSPGFDRRQRNFAGHDVTGKAQRAGNRHRRHGSRSSACRRDRARRIRASNRPADTRAAARNRPPGESPPSAAPASRIPRGSRPAHNSRESHGRTPSSAAHRHSNKCGACASRAVPGIRQASAPFRPCDKRSTSRRQYRRADTCCRSRLNLFAAARQSVRPLRPAASSCSPASRHERAVPAAMRSRANAAMICCRSDVERHAEFRLRSRHARVGNRAAADHRVHAQPNQRRGFNLSLRRRNSLPARRNCRHLRCTPRRSAC